MTGLPGSSALRNPPANAGDTGLILGLGRSPGEKKGNPLQYSCMEKSHGQRNLEGQSPWDRRVRHDLATKQQQSQKVTPFSLNPSFEGLFLYQRQHFRARKVYFEVHIHMWSVNFKNTCSHKIPLQKHLMKAWWWFTLVIWSTDSVEWIGCCRSLFVCFSLLLLKIADPF